MSTSSSRALILTRSPSPPRIRLAPPQNTEWQPILHASNQVVLYNPHSHALSVTSASTSRPAAALTLRRCPPALSDSVHPCPYCNRNLPEGFHRFTSVPSLRETLLDGSTVGEEEIDTDPAYHSRASDYFQLLATANDRSSRTSSSQPPTPIFSELDESQLGNESVRASSPSQEEYKSETGAFPADKMAEGYFKTFFQEECKLGMGANGSVFLCQHVLDGNPLGHFAVKKIAVGESHSYLLKILKEVRLLERLRHPNIITYHHAWLETSRFSSFGPSIPTLFVLMQWAEGGSLDDFIDVRHGRKPSHLNMHPCHTPTGRLSETSRATSPTPSAHGDDADNTPVESNFTTVGNENSEKSQQARSPPGDLHSRSARIRAFREYRRAPADEKERMRREVGDMFTGIQAGNVDPNGGVGEGRKEWTAVHLLSAEEVHGLFRDVVEGLGFLHSKSILHLDLKPGNVLLTWDEGRLIPRAMLSDFGTSRDMVRSTLKRSGNTGTLEYTAPESLPSPQTGLLRHIDSKADMWSLGMILHKLLFFKLPYRYAAESDANGEPISRNEEGEKAIRLEKEVITYPGFTSTPTLVANFEARWLPRSFLVLLETLLNKTPSVRPTCERIAEAIRKGKFDPVRTDKLPVARVINGLPSGSHLTPESEISPRESENVILTLPSTTDNSSSEVNLMRAWFNWGSLRIFLDVEQRRRWAETMARLVQSVLLIVKVMTLRGMCPHPLTRPRPVVVALLLGLAILDAVLSRDDGYEPVRRRGSKAAGTARPEGLVVRNRSPMLRLLSHFGRRIWITVGLTMVHFGLVFLSSVEDGRGTFGTVLGRRNCCVPI